MVELKFKSIIRSKNKRRIDIKNKRDNTPNILKSNSKNIISNNSLCTDVTFIKWRDKFIYLSAAIGLRNNKIVGWNIFKKWFKSCFKYF